MTEVLFGFYKQLNYYKGTLYYLESQLNKNRDRIKNNYSDDHINKFFAGYRLAVSDLTESLDEGWRINYATPAAFSVSGKEYVEFVDKIIERESAWTVSQTYESYESFLKKILSVFLFHNKTFADPKKVSAFINNKCPDFNIDNNVEKWTEYLNYSYRGKNNRKIFNLLRQINPELRDFEIQNNRSLNLIDWFEVYSEVRHAVTHSNFVVETNLSITYKTILDLLFPGEQVKTGYQLKMSPKNVERNLEINVDYAFLIYKFLSISARYNYKVLR